MWIWYLSASDGGNLTKIAAQAHAAGITTLYVKSSDGGSNFWSQFSPTLVAAVHALGLQICAWQFVYGNDPLGEAQLGVRAVQAGADCLVIDAEDEYGGKYAAAQTYIDTLRAAVGPAYPVGLASLPYVDYHESVPYSVFLGPGGAQFNAPQVYWKTIGTSPDGAYAHMYVQNRIYGRVMVPLGQFYGGVSAAEIERFRAVATAYGAPGVSWWDWQSSSPSSWPALTAPDHRHPRHHRRRRVAGAAARLARRSGRVDAGIPRGGGAPDPHERHLRCDHDRGARGLPDGAWPARERGHRRRHLAGPPGPHAGCGQLGRDDGTDHLHRADGHDGGDRRNGRDRHDGGDRRHRDRRARPARPAATGATRGERPERPDLIRPAYPRAAALGIGSSAWSCPMSRAKCTARTAPSRSA